MLNIRRNSDDCCSSSGSRIGMSVANRSPMLFSLTWRRLLLLSLLVSALISAAVSLRYAKKIDPGIQVTSSESMHTGVAEAPPLVPVGHASARSNPAAQRPGPPDGKAQRSSAASAESAARAAANLANFAPSPAN